MPGWPKHGDGWFPIQVTPVEVRQVRESLAAQGRTGVTINVPAEQDELATLDEYAEAGAERATFHLETMPEPATLRKLDELAAVITRYRSCGE